MIWLPAGGAKSPPSAETIARGEHYVRMEGKETYRFATQTLATTALDVDPAGRPRARRHRPVHPAPGQHPDHRGGRQGPRPADGADVRQPRQVRQHVGGVGADRPGRGGQRGPASRSATTIVIVAFGAGFTSRRGDDRVDRRPGARHRRRRRGPTRGRPRPAAGRLGLGRPDPRGAGRAHGAGPARSTSRSTTSSRASPSHAPRGGPRMIDLTGKTRARDRRLARHRPGDRAAPRDPGRRRRVQLPRQRGGGRGETARAIEALGRRALAVQGDVRDPEAADGARQGRRSRRSARSTSSSTTPASPATT